MSAVKWETGNKYIKVAIDPKGGSDFVDAGTNQLLSVPYAIYADKAGVAKNSGGSDRAGTVSTSAAGTGTVNYLTKFTAANTIYNSQLFDNGTNIGIGTTTPQARLHLNNTANSLTEIRVQGSNGGANASSRLSFFGDNSSAFSSTANYAVMNKQSSGMTGNYSPGFKNSKLFTFANSQGSMILNAGGNIGFGYFNQAAGTTTTRMLIDSLTGNVGIGTTAPTAKLDVNGQIRMQGGSPGAGKIMTSDATGIGSWITTSAAGLVSGTGSANSIPKFTGSNSLGNSVMTESGGNIGIGTVTPAAKLDVKTTSNYVAQFNGVTPMYMGLFENDVYRGYIGSYTGNDKDVDFGSGAGTNGKVHLTTNATPRLSVDSAGRVGVGTTSPNHLVHINGGDLFVQSSSGLIRFGYNGSNEWQMATTGAGADLRWYTTPDGGTTITPRHYFQQNGNVGIGGFSGPGLPLGRLDVLGAGSTSSTNTFLLRNSLGDTLLRMRDDGRMGIGYNGTSYGRTMNLGGTGINFYTTNGTAFGGAIFPTDTSLVLWSNSNANNYLVMQPSWGNTGIGTYTPNAKLHLNGAMLIGGNSANPATGYELSVDGDVIAESFVTLNSTSWPDYVFSENYKLMPLNELEQSIKENKHLPKIPPASVMESKGINLGDMTVSLTEKIEELTLYLIELNKKNEELTNRVKQLESQLK
jgi:hypothetical protein